MEQGKTPDARPSEVRRLGRTYCLDRDRASELLDTLSFLRRRLEAPEESFPDMLDRFIRESGRRPSEIYRAADMDRRTFSKLRMYPKHPVSKRQIVSLGLVLRLTAGQLDALLRAAGLALSGSDPEDVLVRHLFEKRIFEEDAISILLCELRLEDFRC